MRRRLWLLPLITCLLPVSLPADSSRPRVVAQSDVGKSAKPTDKAKDSRKPVEKDPIAKVKPLLVITPERESAVMTFVQQHHAELAELLVRLKETNGKEYDRAIRDLYRNSERLAQVRERDIDRYELELKQWQAQSRIDLLSARLKMTSSDELRAQLRQILNEQVDLKQSILQLERQRTAEKLQKLDAQLNDLSRSRQDAVERQLRLLTGGSDKPPPKGVDKANAKTKDKNKK